MNKLKLERCSKCILPANYPGISLDENGTCSLCKDYILTNYLGVEKFKEDISLILKKYPNRKYDCVLGLSGGRDSTYLLHILTKELNLKLIAFFIDSGFIPQHTIDNVKNAIKKPELS